MENLAARSLSPTYRYCWLHSNNLWTFLSYTQGVGIAGACKRYEICSLSPEWVVLAQSGERPGYRRLHGVRALVLVDRFEHFFRSP
jgi:hypothetical protein